MSEFVILVDENDSPRGIMEKQEAHIKGELHRALSVFIVNSEGQLLIHQRALEKYHSGGLWTNTCCSHPRPHENIEDAAIRRLKEEMGLSCELRKVIEFKYKAVFNNGLTEHEYDHVFIGKSDNNPMPDPGEVMDWKWIDPLQLQADMQNAPEKYTAWFRIVLDDVLKHF